MAKLFFSYSHKDEELRNRLETGLKMLERQGLIEPWHDRRITAGDEFKGAIDRHLEEADVILLLVSPDFLASDYCYDVEMTRALERQQAGVARVIPVILRRCDWHHAPFGALLATPPDGKPVRSYADLDDDFHEVTTAIRQAVEAMSENEAGAPVQRVVESRAGQVASERVGLGPRSSTLALPRSFTDRDRHCFLDETYDYIRTFFENSLGELQKRNPGVDASFRKVSENRFTVTVYRNGKEITGCAIMLDGQMGKGISFSNDLHGNGFSEHLSVGSDDQGMFLKSMGMGFGRGNRDEKLTQEAGAELLWSMLLQRLQ